MTVLAEDLSATSWVNDIGHGDGSAGDSGLQSLVAVAATLDIAVDPEQIRHAFGRPGAACDEGDLLRICRRVGIRARALDVDWTAPARPPLPALAVDRESGRYVALLGTTPDGVATFDPTRRERAVLDADALAARFSPRLVPCARGGETVRGPPYGLAWFLTPLRRYVPRLLQVFAASVVLQLFALASPLLFQTITDRVLGSRALDSLQVLAAGLLLIAAFEPGMDYLRGRIFAHAASCFSAELSTKLFSHLVHLPLSFFGVRRSGDIIARVREMDRVRGFVTGAALMLVVDLLFFVVFVAVMFDYSAELAGFVIGSLVLYLLVWLAVAPLFRARIERQYERLSDSTACLTEAVLGIETIKSLAVGDKFTRDWEEKLAEYLRTSFSASVIGNVGGSLIGLVQKLASALVLWYGVRLVLRNELTVGELLAFTMLSSHVTGPVLRLAQTWQEFQRIGVSLRRLGDILAARPEPAAGAGRAAIGRIEGGIELRRLTFRYSDDGPEVLRRLDFKVRPGEVVGITGASGSGKSTLTKLVQRLYVPQSGQVLVDGVDLSLAAPALVRRQMGVVLQENFLFNGTVAANIAMGNRTAGPEDIRHAAQLAGADAFIQRLPKGYDTEVGERAGLLSGGQRQRLALARALVGDPRIFIFDEATSALDYETEAGILERLPSIVRGRTALIIAHRLNVMRLCHRIVVLEHGAIIEEGTHDTLLAAGGRYAELWTLQNR